MREPRSRRFSKAPMRNYSGDAPGGWGRGSPNRTFAIFLGIFVLLIGTAVWWNVSSVAANRAEAAAAAPRLECTFERWCAAEDCGVEGPAPFLIITQGEFGRSYLRMENRGGQLRGAFEDERDPRYWRQYVQWAPERGEIGVNLTEALAFDFTYMLEPGQEADIADASATGSGQCNWIVRERDAS